MKPVRTQAAECIPQVFEKLSIVKPSRNERIINSQLGVSKGSKRIKRTYKYGFKYPLH
jgi:hypothetical protein